MFRTHAQKHKAGVELHGAYAAFNSKEVHGKKAPEEKGSWDANVSRQDTSSPNFAKYTRTPKSFFGKASLLANMLRQISKFGFRDKITFARLLGSGKSLGESVAIVMDRRAAAKAKHAQKADQKSAPSNAANATGGITYRPESSDSPTGVSSISSRLETGEVDGKGPSGTSQVKKTRTRKVASRRLKKGAKVGGKGLFRVIGFGAHSISKFSSLVSKAFGWLGKKSDQLADKLEEKPQEPNPPAGEAEKKAKKS
jgi:hypothetical protein